MPRYFNYIDYVSNESLCRLVKCCIKFRYMVPRYELLRRSWFHAGLLKLARERNIEGLQYLLKRPMDNKLSRLALQHACIGNNMPVVRVMTQYLLGKIGPFTLTEWGQDCIERASERGHVLVVKFLVDTIPVPMRGNVDYSMAVLHASRNGHLDVIRFLCNDTNIMQGSCNQMAWSLLVAAKNRHLETVRFLLAHRKHLDREMILEALSCAVKCLNKDITLCIVEELEWSDWTKDIVEYACHTGHYEIVRYLTRNGFRKEDRNKGSYLRAACTCGWMDVVQQITRTMKIKNYDLDIRNGNIDNGDTRTKKHTLLEKGLGWASYAGHMCIVRHFVSLNVWNHDAICLASHGGHVKVVEYLISKGAKPHIYNNEPVILASLGGHLEMVRYLCSFPTVNPGDRGNQALRYAVSYKHVDVLQYLSKMKK